ncbi:MAG: L,D-transpeptidase family protein [Desulfobacterales bacterium]|nr:L,D-transpeptidase family protein [Desulfobacterales bacterium]
MPQANKKLKKGREVHHKLKIIVLLIILFLINLKAFANIEEMLPDSLVLLPENSNALLVEKSSQQVFLYSRGETEIIERYRFSCSTGEAHGIKIKSGDKKTPEGVYFIKDEYEDKDLSPIYGGKAFPIDYPNFMDKVARRSGNNIWLHGTNKVLKAMDSNGCVAMENENILKLSEFVIIDKTPVIIVDILAKTDRNNLDSQSRMIQDWFETWENAINKGSYHDYLSLYDSDYLPEIVWWKKWYDIRNKTAKDIGDFTLIISNKGIYKQNDIYVVIFNMGLKLLKQNIDFGIRKLFVVKKNNSYKIIGDVYQTRDNTKECKKSSPLVATADSLVQKTEQGPDIRDIIQDWLKAWTSKNMDEYSKYYSKDFHSDGLNKKEWLKRKKSLAKRYGYISVLASNFQVDKGKDNITIRFIQDYKSSGFSATGIKTLIFINEDKEWKIYRESWKKK